MKVALCDANVVVKWFHDEPGPETQAARRLAEAADDGLVELKVLDLTYYEAGNVFQKLGASGEAIATLLDQLHEVCGAGLAMDRRRRAAVAEVAVKAALSFYDAAYVALADQHRLTLVSADKAVVKAGGMLPSRYLKTLSAT
jgi:predicted nucleic acid-binding protein